MKQSILFGKTRKDISRDEKSINAELLTKAGFIEKHMAGVYNYLPLGLKVYRKIENVIREEMNNIGAQEILMSSLQSKELWNKTGRWEEMEEIMYQFKDHHGTDIGLGTTNEEVVTDIVKKYLTSYKDLPIYLYQIQNKFRDEKRAKSGLLRGREFSMKDLYSFNKDENDMNKYYEKVHKAYIKIFNRLGLNAFSVEASGGDMSKEYSHEFMVKTKAGEDITVLCSNCNWAKNKEISEVKKGDKCPKCNKIIEEYKTVEAGNIFKLGTKYSESMNLRYTDKDDKKKLVIMGSYGIGLGRVIGTIVEASNDENGIIWTKETTPYNVHLLNLTKNDKKKADKIYIELKKQGIEVLYDDREISFGKKLKDSDLIGICLQIIVNDNSNLELTERNNKEKTILSLSKAIKLIKKYYK